MPGSCCCNVTPTNPKADLQPALQLDKTCRMNQPTSFCLQGLTSVDLFSTHVVTPLKRVADLVNSSLAPVDLLKACRRCQWTFAAAR